MLRKQKKGGAPEGGGVALIYKRVKKKECCPEQKSRALQTKGSVLDGLRGKKSAYLKRGD